MKLSTLRIYARWLSVIAKGKLLAIFPLISLESWLSLSEFSLLYSGIICVLLCRKVFLLKAGVSSSFFAWSKLGIAESSLVTLLLIEGF